MKSKTLLLIITTVALFGCEPSGQMVYENTEINKWIHSQMKTHYLWADKIGAYSSSELSPDLYFDNHIRFRSPISTFLGDRFSFVRRKDAATRSGEQLHDFGFTLRYHGPSESTIQHCQVLYVVRDSPADHAGIYRGMNFNALVADGKPHDFPMTLYEIQEILSNSASLKLQCFYPEEKIVAVTKAMYYDHPVIFDTIYETTAGATGYLVYNHFSSGDHNRYDNLLKSVFFNFKDHGVENLIVDLRYNGGGELLTATLLSSMIVPRDNLGKPFIYLEHNTSSDPADFKTEYFLDSEVNTHYNIDAKKLYVITSDNTASASELLLHGLRPFFGPDDVVQVGGRTAGKNLGGIRIDRRQYEWLLSPITMRVYNVNKVSGYEYGLVPNVAVYTEYFSANLAPEYPQYAAMPALSKFGDTAYDPMLAAALEHLTDGTSISGRTEAVRRDAPTKSGFEYADIPERGLIEEIIVID